MSSTSPFYIPVDLNHTALLLSDVQKQILSRFSPDTQKAYLDQICRLLDFFRARQAEARAAEATSHSLYEGVPMIIHQTLPFGVNRNAFVSPYNKLSKWVKSLEEKGFFTHEGADPHHPNYAIPDQIVPPNGWSKDEVVVSKLQPNGFGSSDLLAYLRARGIHHVVLVGLTTMGSVLGSARAGADLDFHIITPREGIIDDDPEVDEFLMTKVLPKFVDVVSVQDVLDLGKS
jgi:nicotinamidase-related amidase